MSQELARVSEAPKALTLAKKKRWRSGSVRHQHRQRCGLGIRPAADQDHEAGRPSAHPKLEGDETAPSIEGVIVYARDTRAYYAAKNAGSVPPDCSSPDAIAGRVEAGNQPGRRVRKWPDGAVRQRRDSDGRAGDGQACKQ